MAIKAKPLVLSLTATNAKLLTSGSNEVLTLQKVLACNTDSSARTVTIYHGQTAATGMNAASTVLAQYSMQSKETKVLPLSSVFLANGGYIGGRADSASLVTISINYTSTDQTP